MSIKSRTVFPKGRGWVRATATPNTFLKLSEHCKANLKNKAFYSVSQLLKRWYSSEVKYFGNFKLKLVVKIKNN